MRRAEDTDRRVRSAHQRALVPGEVVFDEGEPGDELFVVQSGEIELVRRGLGGPRRVARFGAGDFFGEISALEGTQRTARAVAIGPACVLRLDRATLAAMCVGEPEIALRLIRGLARRLLDAEHRLAQIDVDEVMGPLVRALLGAAQPDLRHGSRVPLTLRGIAHATGLTLREAHEALQRLFEQGVLQLVDDCLVIPDLGRLSRPIADPASSAGG